VIPQQGVESAHDAKRPLTAWQGACHRGMVYRIFARGRKAGSPYPNGGPSGVPGPDASAIGTAAAFDFRLKKAFF